jgi:hypothetical protein
MGVEFDYFRSPEAKTAKQAIDRLGGPLFPEPAFDGVEAKWIDPCVKLGKLVALIRGVPYELDMVRTIGVWPLPESAPKTEEEYDALPDDSPWKDDGPLLEELDVQTRDTLASVDDGQVPALAAQWVQIEEFHNAADLEYMRSLIQELVDLARRARNSGDQLFCWSNQ